MEPYGYRHRVSERSVASIADTLCPFLEERASNISGLEGGYSSNSRIEEYVNIAKIAHADVARLEEDSYH
jgi:hypothetical protein